MHIAVRRSASRSVFGLLAVVTAIAICLAVLSAWSVQAAPDTKLDRPAYLISQQRYRDAADYLATATGPSSVQSLTARATLLLYAGRPAEASAAFAALRDRIPADEALPDYGQALCALMSHDGAGAASLLSHASERPTYGQHTADIDSAAGVAELAQGNPSKALSLASGAKDSPLAQAIVTFVRMRQNSGDADALADAEKLLGASQLPGGVPRVTEQPGLSVLSALDPDGANGRAINPAIPSVSDRSYVYAQLFPRSSGTTITVGAAPQQVSGKVLLFPKSLAPTAGDMVSFFVDGDVAAVVNSPPFAYRWDASQAVNGLHTVRISLSPSAGGPDETETRVLLVAGGKSSGPPAAAPQPVVEPVLTDSDRIAIADAWELLRLNPGYRAMNSALARAEASAGRADSARGYQSVASAIDFDYAGGAASIAPLFAGHMVAWFPLPPGSHAIEAGAKPTSAGNRTMGIWRGRADIKEVALTFDDGPSPTDTPPMLDALEAANVPGTFFVVGTRAQAVPQILRRMQADGDEVEDHTYTHPNLDEAIPAHIYEEILRDAVVIRACTGIWPHFLRPPGGQSDPHVLKAAQVCGMAGAFWTVDVLPAEDSGSPANVIKLVMGNVRPGAIVLMHNGAYATTHAIPQLAAALRAKGYRMVTLLQLANDTIHSSAQ